MFPSQKSRRMRFHDEVQPLVSLLVTSYNHESYIRQALDSVKNQTYGNVEVIITDDCSTDKSATIIQEWLDENNFSATFIANTVNMGICAVRNQALELARGKYICTLSTDDWYDEDHIKFQVAAFEQLPETVAFIFSDIREVDASSQQILEGQFSSLAETMEQLSSSLFERILRGNFIPAPTVMMRRRALEEVGGYDESLYYEDFDMWLKLSFRFDAHYVPGVVGSYRVLNGSMSHSALLRPRMIEAELAIYTKWLSVEELSSSAHQLCIEKIYLYSHTLAKQGNKLRARQGFRTVLAVQPLWSWRIGAFLTTTPGCSPLWTIAQRVKLLWKTVASRQVQNNSSHSLASDS